MSSPVVHSSAFTQQDLESLLVNLQNFLLHTNKPKSESLCSECSISYNSRSLCDLNKIDDHQEVTPKNFRRQRQDFINQQSLSGRTTTNTSNSVRSLLRQQPPPVSSTSVSSHDSEISTTTTMPVDSPWSWNNTPSSTNTDHRRFVKRREPEYSPDTDMDRRRQTMEYRQQLDEQIREKRAREMAAKVAERKEDETLDRKLRQEQRQIREEFESEHRNNRSIDLTEHDDDDNYLNSSPPNRKRNLSTRTGHRTVATQTDLALLAAMFDDITATGNRQQRQKSLRENSARQLSKSLVQLNKIANGTSNNKNQRPPWKK